MMKLWKYLPLVLVILGAGTFRVWSDYALTQGAGTNFASKVISTVHYPATLNCDPTAGETTCAAVKAASTPVAATDTALVVGISPNSPATIVQPTAASLNATVVGNGTFAVQAAATQASGSVASGAYSSGAFAVGSGTDGWNVTTGTKADTPCTLPASGTACSQVALEKAMANALSSYVGGYSATQLSAAGSSLVIKASAGDLISVSGSAASGAFIMLFDATTAPADGAVTPKKCWGPLAAAGPFAFGWGPGPVLHFSTGIVAVSSSTGCFTKTGVNAPFIAAEFN